MWLWKVTPQADPPYHIFWPADVPQQLNKLKLNICIVLIGNIWNFKMTTMWKVFACSDERTQHLETNLRSFPMHFTVFHLRDGGKLFLK